MQHSNLALIWVATKKLLSLTTVQINFLTNASKAIMQNIRNQPVTSIKTFE